MNFIINFITLAFVVLGIATLIRYIVWKITDSGQNNYHYLIMLNNNDAEVIIRAIIEKNNFDIESKKRVIYALDMGLDEQTVLACKKLADMYPQIIFCKPHEFAELIKT